MTIKYKKLSETAVAPVKAHDTDAGWDLVASRITSEINECGQFLLVYHTDLAIEIPDGYFGALVQRSSVARKSISMCNAIGIIHSCDRGEVTAKFRSTTDVVPAMYNLGEKFAQLLILPVPDVQFEEADQLSETDRGEGGYGSTDQQSAPTATQSLPDTKGEPTNSETANIGSGEAENSLEEA